MPARKKANSTGQSNVSKVGRPVAVIETHPELINTYMELKPMVYDNLNLPDENEITRMIRDFNGRLARKETSTYGAFFRQLLDMFNVMTLSEDYSNLILVHFPEGKFLDKFHHYLDTVNLMCFFCVL